MKKSRLSLGEIAEGDDQVQSRDELLGVLPCGVLRENDLGETAYSSDLVVIDDPPKEESHTDGSTSTDTNREDTIATLFDSTDGWQELGEHGTLDGHFIYSNHDEESAVLCEGMPATILDAFLTIVTPGVIQAILSSSPQSYHKSIITVRKYYIFLAYDLFMRANSFRVGAKCTLEDDFNVARFFLHRSMGFHDKSIPRGCGFVIDSYCYYRSHVCFDEPEFDHLNSSFRSFLRHPGSVVNGDEKLMKADDTVNNYIVCPSKPTKAGVWYCELAVRLEGDYPYIIDILLRKTPQHNGGRRMQVVEFVQHWLQVIETYTSPDYKRPMLVFDGFYCSRASVSLLLRENWLFCIVMKAAILTSSMWFKLRNKLHHDETRSSHEWHGVLHEEHQVLVVASQLKRRNAKQREVYCATNVVQKVPHHTRTPESKLIPGSDLYRHNFNLCDRFNARIHMVCSKHPPRPRENCISCAVTHEFVMSVIMTNLCSLHASRNFTDVEGTSIGAITTSLAIMLYKHACSLPERCEFDCVVENKP